MPRRNNSAPQRRIPTTNPCAQKRHFRSEHDALDAIEDGNLQDGELQLRSYKCPYCTNWHLSSATPLMT